MAVSPGDGGDVTSSRQELLDSYVLVTLHRWHPIQGADHQTWMSQWIFFFVFVLFHFRFVSLGRDGRRSVGCPPWEWLEKLQVQVTVGTQLNQPIPVWHWGLSLFSISPSTVTSFCPYYSPLCSSSFLSVCVVSPCVWCSSCCGCLSPHNPNLEYEIVLLLGRKENSTPSLLSLSPCVSSAKWCKCFSLASLNWTLTTLSVQGLRFYSAPSFFLELDDAVWSIAACLITPNQT